MESNQTNQSPLDKASGRSPVRWFKQTLSAIAYFASGVAVTLAAAMHFGYLPSATAPSLEDSVEGLNLTQEESTETSGLADEATLAESDTNKNDFAQNDVSNAEPSSSSSSREKRGSSRAGKTRKGAKATDKSKGKEESLDLLIAMDKMTGEPVAAPSEPTSKDTTSVPEAKEIQAAPSQAQAQATQEPRDASVPDFDRSAIMNDAQNRINDQFSIPADLRDRVGFWFDVYSKYDSNRRIIHHSRYPWVVFKVVDVSPIINAPTPSRRWMRNEKAEKHTKQEAERIRAAIRSLASRSSMKNLNPYEQMVADALSKLGGDVRKRARNAIGEVRTQMGQRDFFEEGLKVSPRYLGTMERIFVDAGLPIELTRIPFVESSFNKHATSKVGATGIWQFMGNTGRKFMIVNGTIDERRSPFKATEGAARLLKENHMILYRSWPLAVTAWNHGPGGVRKASQAVGSRELAKIVANYRSRSFDFASSNFYSEFLAALHTERYNDQIFPRLDREQALDLHVIKLPRSIRTREIIQVSGLTKDEFLVLNPELKAAANVNALLPKGFKLHVPATARTGIERHLADTGKNTDRKS